MSITIYTTNTCAYCIMVKKYLDRKGLFYREINTDDHPEKRLEAYDLSGVVTVPITVVERDDRKVIIIGYNLSKLAPAIS